VYLVVRHVDNHSNFNYALDLSGYDRDIKYQCVKALVIFMCINRI